MTVYVKMDSLQLVARKHFIPQPFWKNMRSLTQKNEFIGNYKREEFAYMRTLSFLFREFFSFLYFYVYGVKGKGIYKKLVCKHNCHRGLLLLLLEPIFRYNKIEINHAMGALLMC